jgi:signal transduction histidine kinase
VSTIAAADAERRRLERNLHDGAQQRLVSLALDLRAVEAHLTNDPDAARRKLASAREELALALEELRDLARGMHPAVLRHRGLGPALNALAARAPEPVRVAALPGERLPEPVEAAAYYVVAEALTNVSRHARATSVTVSVTRTGDRARIEVRDDGSGGADPGHGSGLRGLADRLEALGGRLELHSPPGAGTALIGELPIYSGQKSGTFSTSPITSSPLGEIMMRTASSGPSFQTERTTSGAMRTTVPGPASKTSSPSLNWRVPCTTQ